MSAEKLRVLLIEDNPGDVRLIREMLVEAKHTVFDLECLDRLTDGLARLTESEFDVVLLDLSLPDSTGLDTFVTFNSAAEQLPVVILSGLKDETTAVECVNAGAQDYLIKDEVNSHLLIRSLRYAVARGLLEKERFELLARERTARAQAEEANRTKDEFLAIVSHELRTPLSAMLGWSRMLATGKLDAETARRGIEAIERNARAQTQLIADLLDISRITTGKLQLNARPLKLEAIITNTIDAMGPTAQAKQISLRAKLDDAGYISGDPDRLQQIVWNLLSNAIKFTPTQGRVEVSVKRADAYVQVSVADSGQGISAEFMPYVFERFRQADSSTTRKFGGLGLGLSIVKHLVELHGGVIEVHSNGEGHGATFTVGFPWLRQFEEASALTMPAEECETPVGQNEPSLHGVRVLVVDDDTDSRAVIAEMLMQFGGDVLTAASAHEALQAVELWAPHVLLSDIEMPNEDGYSLLQKVRNTDGKRGRFLPAAALTAYGRPTDRVRALKAGFQTYISKPVDPHELAHVVASLAKGSDVSTSSKA